MGSYVDFQLFRFSGFPSPHPTPSGLPAVYQPKRRIRTRWLSIFHRISTQPCQQAGITFSHAGEARTRIYADGDNAYCIEPGISLHTGNTLEKDASVVWNNLGSLNFPARRKIRDKKSRIAEIPREIKTVYVISKPPF